MGKLPETEEEIEQRLNEAEEKLNKKTNINIKFDREGFEKQVLEKKELEEQLEEERTLREDYESKLRLIAEQRLQEKKTELGAPDWITTPSELQKWAEAEGKNAGAGVVSLRPEDLQRERHGSGKDGFDSNEQMIDHLRSEAQKGNREAKENLNKLWLKTVNAMKEDPQKVAGGIKYQLSKKEFMEKSSVERLKEAQNKAWRAKEGYVEKE